MCSICGSMMLNGGADIWFLKVFISQICFNLLQKLPLVVIAWPLMAIKKQALCYRGCPWCVLVSKNLRFGSRGKIMETKFSEMVITRLLPFFKISNLDKFRTYEIPVVVCFWCSSFLHAPFYYVRNCSQLMSNA